jgi:hypothetical protein
MQSHGDSKVANLFESKSKLIEKNDIGLAKFAQVMSKSGEYCASGQMLILTQSSNFIEQTISCLIVPLAIGHPKIFLAPKNVPFKIFSTTCVNSEAYLF